MLRTFIVALLVSLPVFADTHTSATSGNFSAGATWVGGSAPSDGDAIVIAAEHNVTLDVDNSGWATGLAASTVTGTFTLGTGTVGLVFAGALSGTGSIQAGTSLESPYATTNQANLVFGTNGRISLSGACGLYCTQPTILKAFTKQANSIAETKIYVTQAVETDAEWKAGYYIRFDDIAGAAESEEFTISNTGSDGGGSYVTLSAGLAAAKTSGAVITLIGRNIMCTGNGVAGCYLFNSIHGSTLNVGARNFGRGMNSCYSLTVSSFAPSGCSLGVYLLYLSTFDNLMPDACTNGAQIVYGNTISQFAASGCLNGMLNSYANTFEYEASTGCANGWSQCYGNSVNNSATSLGCGSAYVLCTDNRFTSASLSLNTNAVNTCSGNWFGGGTWANNTYHVKSGSSNMWLNTTFTGGTKYESCNRPNQSPFAYGESLNDGNVAGQFSAKTNGGETIHDTSVYPSGYTMSYKHTCSDSGSPCFRQVYFKPLPNSRTTFKVQYKTLLTGCMAEIVNEFSDPLGSGTALETVALDNNDNAWHTVALTYYNDLGYEVPCVARISATASSGVLYERCDLISGAGGVKIQ